MLPAVHRYMRLSAEENIDELSKAYGEHIKEIGKLDYVRQKCDFVALGIKN